MSVAVISLLQSKTNVPARRPGSCLIPGHDTEHGYSYSSRGFACFRNHIHRLWINDTSMYIAGVKVLYASTKLRDLVTQQDLKPIRFLPVLCDHFLDKCRSRICVFENHPLLVPTFQMLHLLVHHYSPLFTISCKRELALKRYWKFEGGGRVLRSNWVVTLPPCLWFDFPLHCFEFTGHTFNKNTCILVAWGKPLKLNRWFLFHYLCLVTHFVFSFGTTDTVCYLCAAAQMMWLSI